MQRQKRPAILFPSAFLGLAFIGTTLSQARRAGECSALPSSTRSRGVGPAVVHGRPLEYGPRPASFVRGTHSRSPTGLISCMGQFCRSQLLHLQHPCWIPRPTRRPSLPALHTAQDGCSNRVGAALQSWNRCVCRLLGTHGENKANQQKTCPYRNRNPTHMKLLTSCQMWVRESIGLKAQFPF